MYNETVRREVRKQQILKRKNFFPVFIITVALWLTLGMIVYFLDPGEFGAIPLFFTILFSAALFTSSVIFGNSRRGLIVASSISLFLFLRILGIGNIINLILILGIAITSDLFFSKK